MLRIRTLHSNGAEVGRQSILSHTDTTENNQDQSHVVTVHEWGKQPTGFPFVQESGQNTLCWLARKWWRNCLIPHKKQSLSSSLQQHQDFNTSSTTQKCGLIPKHTRTAGPRLEGGINLTRMGYFLLDPRRSRTVRQCQSSLSTQLSAIAVGELDEWQPF